MRQKSFKITYGLRDRGMRKLPNIKGQHGQSMIETALMFPILLVLFAGMLEIVFIARSYLVILDSSYQGAHLGSQGLALFDDNEIYSLVTQNLAPRYNNSNLIDVIITRATLNGGTSLTITEVKHMKGSSRPSILSQAVLSGRLRAGDLSGRLVAVEVVYDHPLLFDFPIVWDLFQNPFPLVAYTIQYVAR
jgi:Flp pilus assembly protein TadG